MKWRLAALALVVMMTSSMVHEVARAAKCSHAEAIEMMQKAGSLARIIEKHAPEYAPYDYQTEYYDDAVNRWLIYKKARRVGASHMGAYKATVKSLSIPNNLTMMVSLSLEEAEEKIEAGRGLYAVLDDRCSGLPRIKNDSAMRLSFTNGSRLISVFTPRGRGPADLILDEWAHTAHATRIWRRRHRSCRRRSHG